MYLFDKEEFNCNELPNDWEDYGSSFRALYDAYVKCVSEYIKYNTSTLPASVVSELNQLLFELNNVKNETFANLLVLLTALTESPLNCFDKTIYTTYMASYSEFKSIAQKIDVLLTTGGDTIGVQPDISVELTTIYPTDGPIKPKTTKCVGVYMKQMNNGSEFIGKVIDDTPIVNNEPAEVPRGYSDGKISVY